jgi:hypothetical protein
MADFSDSACEWTNSIFEIPCERNMTPKIRGVRSGRYLVAEILFEAKYGGSAT